MIKKHLFLTLFTILLVQCSDNKKNIINMDKMQIIETVNQLFIGVDERNWEQVSNVFNDTVLLDYTSMTGGEPAKLTSQQIIDSWKGFLPGFDKTHHQIGNYIVNEDSNTISVFCYGTANHYLKNDSNNNVWTVVGTYDFELKNDLGVLKITKMIFNLKYIEGNSDLARIAQERLKK